MRASNQSSGRLQHDASKIATAEAETARLFQTIPNFIQPGPGAVVIQFSAGGSTCANRSNRLLPELDHNPPPGSFPNGAIESSPFARSARAMVSFLNKTLVYALSCAL